MSLKKIIQEKKASFVYSNVVDLMSGENLQFVCKSVSAVRKEEKAAMLTMTWEHQRSRERLCSTWQALVLGTAGTQSHRGKSQALVLGGGVNQEIMGSCISPQGLSMENPFFLEGVPFSLGFSFGWHRGSVAFEHTVPSLSSCRAGARYPPVACVEADHVTSNALWTVF